MAEIIDVSEWVPSDEPEWMGTRSKVWLQDPTSNEVLWLFKAIRCKEQHDGTVRCFGDDWAEWLAVQAADRLQVPAAEVRLASWQAMPASSRGPCGDTPTAGGASPRAAMLGLSPPRSRPRTWSHAPKGWD